MQPLRLGIMGCGNISGIYLQADQKFPILQTVAVADLDAARAQAQAEKFNVPRASGVDEMLAADDIDIIVNLTPPHAHATVAIAALDSGKHVYNEKPLAIRRDQARQILDLAAERSLRVGCAPDTFLGAGLQTCRKLIDDGAIGRPIAAAGFMVGHGPERWHPDPDFFYKPGGGPLFDMGPYYLTAMVHLIGPIRAVAGAASISMPQREIGSEPRQGERIDVQTPTHVVGALEFAGGAIGNLITSFDVWGANLPRIEIYGTDGSLSVPDPNHFGGPVLVRKAGETQFADVELTHQYPENSRGIGIADMATAIASGRDHRASGQLGFHVLDAMHAILESAEAARHVELTSPGLRPAALPTGLSEGILDD